jgi:hypothetical protein
LDTTTSSRNVTFNSGSVKATGKLLLLCLSALHYGNSEEVFVNLSIEVEHV